MLSKKITKEELLIVTAARQIKDHGVCVLGIGMPILAGALAKKIHAPRAVLLMESGIVDFHPVGLPANVADATCTRGYGYATDLFSVFTTITYAGYLDKAFLGVGQIDRYGNINTSYLGMPPKAQRITAAGGAPEFYGYAKETILTMKGKGFVDKLPYLTSPGYLGGGDERERSGRYRPGSGPSTLITPKGIFNRSFGDNQANRPQSLDLRGISGLYVVRPHRRPQRIRTPIGLQPGSYRAPQGVVQAFGNPFS